MTYDIKKIFILILIFSLLFFTVYTSYANAAVFAIPVATWVSGLIAKEAFGAILLASGVTIAKYGGDKLADYLLHYENFLATNPTFESDIYDATVVDGVISSNVDLVSTGALSSVNNYIQANMTSVSGDLIWQSDLIFPEMVDIVGPKQANVTGLYSAALSLGYPVSSYLTNDAKLPWYTVNYTGLDGQPAISRSLGTVSDSGIVTQSALYGAGYTFEMINNLFNHDLVSIDYSSSNYQHYSTIVNQKTLSDLYINYNDFIPDGSFTANDSYENNGFLFSPYNAILGPHTTTGSDIPNIYLPMAIVTDLSTGMVTGLNLGLNGTFYPLTQEQAPTVTGGRHIDTATLDTVSVPSGVTSTYNDTATLPVAGTVLGGLSVDSLPSISEGVYADVSAKAISSDLTYDYVETNVLESGGVIDAPVTEVGLLTSIYNFLTGFFTDTLYVPPNLDLSNRWDMSSFKNTLLAIAALSGGSSDPPVINIDINRFLNAGAPIHGISNSSYFPESSPLIDFNGAEDIGSGSFGSSLGDFMRSVTGSLMVLYTLRRIWGYVVFDMPTKG